MSDPQALPSESLVVSPEDARSRLLEHPGLWRAGQFAAAARPAVPTGFAVLDRKLLGGGWPRGGLCELLLPTSGIGELGLLAPAMHALGREPRWIAWINPPFIPYAPALHEAGIELGRTLIVRPQRPEDVLWALDQTSRSGACSMVLGWLDGARLGARETRRLQLAAQQGRTLTCLFRPAGSAVQPSMAELRLRLEPGRPGLRVDVLKRRGGWPVEDLRLETGVRLTIEDVRHQLTLWRFHRSTPAAAVSRCSARPAHSEPGTAAGQWH
jgi:hypothetical protein